ncbi:MAG: hypothetical protein WAK16_05010 [Candidatus Cybelea sp.]
MAVQNLMRRAQAAMLGAFDRRDTVTAAQLDAAVPGFSEKTKKRARAGLTRDGILVRGKLGMHGEVTYTLARAASPAYRWPRFSTMRQPGPRMATNDDATLPAERDYADDDDYDYVDDDDETGGYERSGTAGWVVPIGIFACGLAAVVLVRRRFGAFSIGKSDGTARTAQLPPFTPSIAPRARQTPARRAARNAPIVAPYPGDDAIFGHDAPFDETRDLGPAPGPNAYERFAAFPGLFDFYPDSDT